MKKLILLFALLIFACSYGQNALEAALLSESIKKSARERVDDRFDYIDKAVSGFNNALGRPIPQSSKFSCDSWVTYLKKYGDSYKRSSVNYESDAIHHIDWFRAKGLYYSVVYFKKKYSNTTYSKGYVFGGWDLNKNEISMLISEFEKSKSKGTFFWEYIKPSKVDCNPN